MKKNLILIGLIITLLLANNIFAQKQFSQTIRGQVIDQSSAIPLIGVNIVLLNSNPQKGTITDINGEFRLKNVPVGRQTIQCSYIGYNSASIKNLLVSSGKETVLKVEMEEKIVTTEEVVIKAYNRKDKPLNEMAIISARSFSVEETERYAGSFGDPSRMAVNYAGVVSAGDQRNDIVIRGNSPLGLLWRLDGADIPNPNHFGTMGTTGGPISILNNNLLTNSDFYTGAFPAEYGNALSGVFDLKMRAGNNEKREYTGQMGFNGFEFGAEGPFVKSKKASYLINYRYTMMKVMDNIGLLDVGGIPEYQDLSFKMNFPGKKIGKISIFGIGGLSNINLVSNPDDSSGGAHTSDVLQGTKVSYGSDMAVAGLSHIYFLDNTTRIKTNITVSGSRSINMVDTIRANNIYEDFYNDEYVEIKYSFSSQLKKKYNAKNTINFGISYDIFDVSYFDEYYEIEIDDYINLTNTKGSLGLARAFGQWQHKLSDLLVLYNGLHFQSFSLNNDISVEPRTSIKWQFSEKQSLNLGYGLHSQLQPRINYFTETLTDTLKCIYIKTNEALTFSKSHQFVLGYDHLIRQNLRLKMEVYYQNLYNIPVEQRQSYFSMINYGASFYGEKVDSLVNDGTGENYGLEFTIEKFLSNNYYFLLTASLYESKYKGSDNKKRNTAFNGNYVINALGGYEMQIGKHNSLEFNLKGVFAGGKRYIPVNLPKSQIEEETVYDYNRAFEDKFDDYFRIDFRISYKMNLSKSSHTLAFDIQNVTDNENIFNREYDIETGNLKTSYQTGFYPLMTYRIQF